MSAWDPSELEICADIGGRVAKFTGDLRSTTFLRQRLDIATQRGNAAMCWGHSHPDAPPDRFLMTLLHAWFP